MADRDLQERQQTFKLLTTSSAAMKIARAQARVQEKSNMKRALRSTVCRIAKKDLDLKTFRRCEVQLLSDSNIHKRLAARKQLKETFNKTETGHGFLMKRCLLCKLRQMQSNFGVIDDLCKLGKEYLTALTDEILKLLTYYTSFYHSIVAQRHSLVEIKVKDTPKSTTTGTHIAANWLLLLQIAVASR